MKPLTGLVVVSITALLVECSAEFASNHETLLGALGILVIAILFIISVRNSNKNAKQ